VLVHRHAETRVRLADSLAAASISRNFAWVTTTVSNPDSRNTAPRSAASFNRVRQRPSRVVLVSHQKSEPTRLIRCGDRAYRVFLPGNRDSPEYERDEKWHGVTTSRVSRDFDRATETSGQVQKQECRGIACRTQRKPKYPKVTLGETLSRLDALRT
jgi:hypothetical protein